MRNRSRKLALSAILAWLAVIMVVVVGSCGGRNPTPAAAISPMAHQGSSIEDNSKLENYLSELDELPLPEGVDPKVWVSLKERLRDILGYDLGVAITGHEELGLTLVMTEGFGKIPMAPKTFALLKERAGARAALSGATQIRAGVIRPEIIIPFPPEQWETAADDERESAQAVREGDQIRVIREPYFGWLGTVKELTPALERVECETKVRVLEVAFEDGSVATVPRANIERIED